MDRDDTVRISRLAIFGGLTTNDVSLVLMQYCLEHNKPYNETVIFVTNLLRYNMFVEYLGIALDYYKRKFNVCELWSASKPNNIGQRKLLQIF